MQTTQPPSSSRDITQFRLANSIAWVFWHLTPYGHSWPACGRSIEMYGGDREQKFQSNDLWHFRQASRVDSHNA